MAGNFVPTLQALIDHAGANASSAKNGAALASWFLGVQSLWTGDVYDVADIAKAFDRSVIADKYAKALADDGTVGVVASLKTQSDYLSTLERAFRVRHATPVQTVLAAAGRLEGHSNADAGVIKRIAKFTDDLTIAGSI